MMQKLLMPMMAAIVLSVATPSFATFWGQHNDRPTHDRGWDCDWEIERPVRDDCHDWDWDEWCEKIGTSTQDHGDFQWPKFDGDKPDWREHLSKLKDGDFQFPKFDFPKGDWQDMFDCDFPRLGDWHCKPHPKCDPIPEPATAGLSLMGLAALGFAVRRRK